MDVKGIGGFLDVANHPPKIFFKTEHYLEEGYCRADVIVGLDILNEPSHQLHPLLQDAKEKIQNENLDCVFGQYTENLIKSRATPCRYFRYKTEKYQSWNDVEEEVEEFKDEAKTKFNEVIRGNLKQLNQKTPDTLECYEYDYNDEKLKKLK